LTTVLVGAVGAIVVGIFGVEVWLVFGVAVVPVWSTSFAVDVFFAFILLHILEEKEFSALGNFEGL